MVSDSVVLDPTVSKTAAAYRSVSDSKAAYYLVKGVRAGGSAFWRALFDALTVNSRIRVKAIGLHSKASMYLIPADLFNPRKVWGYVIVYARIENPDFSQWCRHLECRDMEIQVNEVKVRDEWGFEFTTKYMIIRDFTNNREYRVYPNARVRDLIVSDTERSRTTDSETKPGPWNSIRDRNLVR